MPGYVIHLAEAELILDNIRNKQQIDDAFEQAFLTGTLLPDTRLKGEKRFSHFWDPEQLDRLALGPDLNRFTDKYEHRLNEPVMLGYLAHLHLDTRYVQEYWPTVMAFYGCKGQIEYRKAYIAEVEVKRLKKRVPVNQFFSTDYYYGDYTKLNGYFVQKYHLRVPEWENIPMLPPDEVHLQDMQMIIRELEHLTGQCHVGDEEEIKVFDLASLEKFMALSAEDFCDKYIYRKDLTNQ